MEECCECERLTRSLQGIVDYASVGVLELRKNMAGTGHDGTTWFHRLNSSSSTNERSSTYENLPSLPVRFGFKNGTADGEATGLSYYPLFGSSSLDTDLTTFVNNLSVRASCSRSRTGSDIFKSLPAFHYRR